jgi:hypothetical protein
LWTSRAAWRRAPPLRFSTLALVARRDVQRELSDHRISLSLLERFDYLSRATSLAKTRVFRIIKEKQ